MKILENLKPFINKYFKIILAVLYLFLGYLFIKAYANPYFVGDDFRFHMHRFLSIGTYFKSPVDFTKFWNTGNAVSLMYPSITLYLSAIIHKFVPNIFMTIKIFLYIFLVVEFYTSYFLAKRYTNSRFLGIVFSVLYVFSTYNFTLLYIRSAFGEFIAFVFLPLIILGLYEVIFKDVKKWWILTIGLTFIAYSHLISIVFAFGISGLIFIIALFAGKMSWRRFWYLVLAFGVFGFLSMITLLPIVQTSLSKTIVGPQFPGRLIRDQAEPLGELIRRSIDNDVIRAPVETSNFHRFRVQLFPFGLICLVALIISIIRFKKNDFINWMFIGIALFFIFMRSTLFPWYLFDTNPKFNFFQFPFRFNTFITIFSLLAFVKQLSQLKDINTKIVGSSFMIATYALFSSGFYVVDAKSIQFFQQDNDHGINRRELMSKITKSDSELMKLITRRTVFDYSNSSRAYIVEKKRSAILLDSPSNYIINNFKIKNRKGYFFVDGVKYSKYKFKVDIKVLSYNLAFTNKKNKIVELVIPVTKNLGTKVFVNNKEVESTISKKYGTISIKLAPNSVNKIKIINNWTSLARLGQWISLFSWVIFIPFLIFKDFILKFVKKFRVVRRNHEA